MTTEALNQMRELLHDELLKTSARWLDTKTAIAYVNGPRTLQHLRDKGLRHSRVSGKLLFDRQEIDQLLESLKK